MYKVYGDILSGNCYKIKLLLKFLDIAHNWVAIDILAGETHTQNFLSINSNGKIPVLEIDGNRYLSESNAILYYLAEGTAFLPNDRFLRAEVLKWQFFEQYSHEPYIAVARYISKYLGLPEDRKNEYHDKQQGGHRALSIMNDHLSDRQFMVGNSPSIADISLYAYTQVADEGGFSLDDYPHVINWIKTIGNIKGYIPMTIESAYL
jgi:glutathione S-transferase